VTAHWLRLAFSGPVVRRGLKFAIVVGLILVSINHADAIVFGQLSAVLWVKIGLTLMVPYWVSVFSSVGAVLEQRAPELPPPRRVVPP
jgi:hypothetical protein